MRTVFERKEETEKMVVKYPYKMEDKATISFEVMGQTPDRTLEDRSVYFNVHTEHTEAEGSEISRDPVNFNMWFDGEEAIRLGQMLIKQGSFALEANITRHHQYVMSTVLKDFILSGIVKELVFKNINVNPVNYGGGFAHFEITPVWKEGKTPEYYDDFSYEEVIYFSPFKDEYEKQIKRYTYGKCDYSFVDYDYEKSVEIFNRECNRFQGDLGSPKEPTGADG